MSFSTSDVVTYYLYGFLFSNKAAQNDKGTPPRRRREPGHRRRIRRIDEILLNRAPVGLEYSHQQERNHFDQARKMDVPYEIIVKGGNLSTRKGSFGLASLTLVFTEQGPVLFDVGHYCNRGGLLRGLKRHGLAPGDLKAARTRKGAGK